MKRMIIMLCFGATCLSAQNVDYNTIILPQSAGEVEFSEELVRLAWQNSPTTQILNRRINMANNNIKQSKWNWLDQVRVTGNLNEFTINPDDNERSEFFPRYNISASVTLGTFFNNPKQTKILRDEMEIAIQDVNNQKLALRAEVLRRYQTYMAAKDMLSIRTEALEDSYANYALVEQQFKNGETNLREFNQILEIYNRRRELKNTAERDFYISKVSLEELVGVKLEDIQ